MTAPTATATATATRPYDGRLRRERAEQTRLRILDAATELQRASSIRDWGALTIRAVAERAQVSERTVYRHFDNERGLRDAVLQRFAEEAGVDLDALQLKDVAGVATSVVHHVAQYPIVPRSPADPTLDVAGRRQREALLGAVGQAAPQLSEQNRTVAAAVLDVLWSPATYERLAGDWQLDADTAAEAMTWAIGLVEASVGSISGETSDE